MSWQVAFLWGFFWLRCIFIPLRLAGIVCEQAMSGEDYEKRKPEMLSSGLTGWIIQLFLQIAFGMAVWTIQ